MDTLTPAERSKRMSLVKSRGSKPELLVRQTAHKLGYRFRLHDRRLPGSPDLVFARHRKVIFVHGCFWHRHQDPTCRLARLPKSRTEFWETKLSANVARDARQAVALETMGWEILVVWECKTRDKEQVRNIIHAFLGGGSAS